MKELVKKLLHFPLRLVTAYVRLLSNAWPSATNAFQDLVYRDVQDLFQRVHYSSPGGLLDMEFQTPNALCRYRVETFSTKEPETLEWMEHYGGGVLYDVGANIGLFSVFYAKRFESHVYAFEPSVLNLALLAKNVSRNLVSDEVILVPMPLSDGFRMAQFRLSMLDEGGSMSEFVTSLNQVTSMDSSELSYETWGVPLDAVVKEPFNFKPPSLLKIDVDGLEDRVLMGANSVLRSSSLRSVLIEVDESDPLVADQVEKILTDAGLTFVDKTRSAMFDDGPFARSYNQIWERASAVG